MESNSIVSKQRIELFFIAVLCVFAIMAGPLSFSSSLRPSAERLEFWFQRSGAITSIFAAFAQFRLGNFLDSIRGGTFAESWWLYRMFVNHHYALSWVAAVVTIWGAFVWGYGDLFIKCFVQ
ncbi:hypothetical protein ACO0LF_03865 [Undibacterium sp. Di27W]|uniref:hypothetical protein n=1 Tax=Undibacterium sp. Di27W TaxID=3413036 RepID=UPI003BF11441